MPKEDQEMVAKLKGLTWEEAEKNYDTISWEKISTK